MTRAVFTTMPAIIPGNEKILGEPDERNSWPSAYSALSNSGAVLSEERSCSPTACSLSGCYAPRYKAALMLRHDGFSARRCGSRDRLAVFSSDTVCRDQSPYGTSESQQPVRPQMADAHLAVDLKVEPSSLAERIKGFQQDRLPSGEANHSSIHGFDICDLGRGFLRRRL